MRDRPRPRALTAKFTFLWQAVHSSPHASELLASRDAEARKVIRDHDEQYEALLVKTIRRAAREGSIQPKRLGLDARGVGRMLMQGAYGARYGADDEPAHRAHVARFVEVLVRGMQS